MHSYSNSSSIISTIFQFISIEKSPVRFCCSNNFSLSHSSIGFSGKNIVETPEAMIAGDLSNLMSFIPITFKT